MSIMRFEPKLRGWSVNGHVLVKRTSAADELEREYREDEVGGFEVDEGDVVDAGVLGLRSSSVTRVRYIAEAALLMDVVENPGDAPYDILAVPVSAVIMVR